MGCSAHLCKIPAEEAPIKTTSGVSFISYYYTTRWQQLSNVSSIPHYALQHGSWPVMVWIKRASSNVLFQILLKSKKVVIVFECRYQGHHSTTAMIHLWSWSSLKSMISSSVITLTQTVYFNYPFLDAQPPKTVFNKFSWHWTVI